MITKLDQYKAINEAASDASIQKKVEEVNKLINQAKDSDGDQLGVIDNSSTWQAEMKFKPFVFKNGVLYSVYSEWTGKGDVEVKDKFTKKTMEDGLGWLNMVARWHRSAIKKAAKPSKEVNEKMSKKAKDFISNKIKKLIDEGKPRNQAIAIAYSMAKEEGFDVPKKKRVIKESSISKYEREFDTLIDDFGKNNVELMFTTGIDGYIKSRTQGQYSFDAIRQNLYNQLNNKEEKSNANEMITSLTLFKLVNESFEDDYDYGMDDEEAASDNDEGELDFQEIEWKMDKFMPDDPVVMDEYYEILDDEDKSDEDKITELEDFFNGEVQDDELLDTYLGNRSLRDFVTFLVKGDQEFYSGR